MLPKTQGAQPPVSQGSAQHGTYTAILHVLNRLKRAHLDELLFIFICDIRRAFDSIPKWLRRIAWVRLGIEEKDLEWFLGLDAVGQITIRTPHQQKHVQTSNDGHQVLAGGRMLLVDHHTSLHPNRGIGQGDTPFMLIFIAVFDIILLTLLENCGTGEAHAYADDLAFLARTLMAQQRQADLVCRFAAYTGIEILVHKVEAI